MSQQEPSSLYHNVAILARLLAGDDEAARAGLAAGLPPPDDFLRFIERHYLVWYLVGQLDASGLRDLFPVAELARLERASEERRAKVARLVEELDRLWLAFGSRGIDAVLLKGPALDQRFYGGQGRRAFFDMDLLVRVEQVPAAERLLVELGYERRSIVLLSRRVTMWAAHGFDFARDGLALDLHWRAAAHTSYRIDATRLLRGGGIYRSSRAEIAVPSDEDMLFLHLLSLFRDLYRGGARIRSFVDLHAMLAELDARIDWPAFWAARRTERTFRVCQTVLGMFLTLFEADERFPRAAAGVLPEHRRCSIEEIAALVEVRERAIRNKLWALRIFECSVPRSLAYWAVSLPFRLATYRAARPPTPKPI
jgi:hypothetical protein